MKTRVDANFRDTEKKVSLGCTVILKSGETIEQGKERAVAKSMGLARKHKMVGATPVITVRG